MLACLFWTENFASHFLQKQKEGISTHMQSVKISTKICNFKLCEQLLFFGINFTKDSYSFINIGNLWFLDPT